jgi:hypothetical protein
MKNKTMLVLYIAAMIMFLPLCHAAIPANEIEMTRALDNSSSNICFTDADCNGHGQCINGTTCICDKGWTTYSNMGGTNKSCLYEQRSKLTAFLVSFFVGTLGVDWFYLSRGNAGYIVAGVFKLLMGCGCCGGWPFVIFGAANGSEMLINIGRLVSSLFSLGTFVWWIVDWARILTEKFPDGNGVGLKPF